MKRLITLLFPFFLIGNSMAEDCKQDIQDTYKVLATKLNTKEDTAMLFSKAWLADMVDGLNTENQTFLIHNARVQTVRTNPIKLSVDGAISKISCSESEGSIKVVLLQTYDTEWVEIHYIYELGDWAVDGLDVKIRSKSYNK